MFCKNCGFQINGDEKYCQQCGNVIENEEAETSPLENDVSSEENTSQTQIKPVNKSEKNKKIAVMLSIGFLALILVSVLALRKPGYEKLLIKYFQSREQLNAQMYYDIVSEDWMKWYSGDTELDAETKEDFLEFLLDDLEDEVEDYKDQCGENISISYEINNEYKASSSELQELKEEVDYLENSNLSDAYLLRVTYTVTGTKGTYTYHFPDGFLAVKVNGKWCVLRGHINISWYHQ